MKKHTSIDAYIAGCAPDIQPMLQALRNIINEAAAQATEGISYGMPVWKLHKNLVYFGAFKKHIGFFPTPSAIRKFEKELIKYDCSKGTIRFPYTSKLPKKLIRAIVKYRVKEDLENGK